MVNISRRQLLAGGSALLVVAVVLDNSFWISPVEAHHGWNGYTRSIKMPVRVDEIDLGNPHDRLKVIDAQGQEWNILLAPPARNRRYGFNKNSLKIGDVVELMGERRPKRYEIKVHCIFKNGETLYTYRYSGGKTSLERLAQARSC